MWAKLKMRIVVLGASGLIGHKLFQTFTDRFEHCFAVLHRDRNVFADCGLFESDKVIDNVDAMDFDHLKGILHAVDPDVILNCVGITKRKPAVNNPIEAITTNSLLPHRLADWGKSNDARVIHFSTDCVFNGGLGNYNEESDTTGEDAYGKTKALGEIRYPHSLTIRSSFIGRELTAKTELLEWFLAQRGSKIRGFTKAWYSGVSTIQMCRVVGDIIENHQDLGGLYQLAMPEPISKYDLLQLANQAFGANVEIEADDSFEIKPTLDGGKLRAAINVELPTWESMMNELAADTLYQESNCA